MASKKPTKKKPVVDQGLMPIGKSFVFLFSTYGAFFLWALWGEHFDSAMFWKITLTYLVITVVLALVYLVRREFGADEQMKNDKFMD